ncbi:MAG: RCC1 repeat- and reductase domain-containing protein [Candidatus Brocadiaceae bacterium]
MKKIKQLSLLFIFIITFGALFNGCASIGHLKIVSEKTKPPSKTIAISCGKYHSLALKDDGTVWAWGNNTINILFGGRILSGQLGNGTTVKEKHIPDNVVDLIEVVAISGGWSSSIALKKDGTIWVWGEYNSVPPRGGGWSLAYQTRPVQLIGLTDIKVISVYKTHCLLALRNDGTVWTWSADLRRDDITVNKPEPFQITGLTDIIAIANGLYHHLALHSDGTVWEWGFISDDVFNVDSPYDIKHHETTPVRVEGLTGITAIAAGNKRSLALMNDGTVWEWGENEHYGQAGDDTTVNKYTPVQVKGLTGVVAITAGGCHSLALKNDGTVWAWGLNTHGSLGDGTTVDKYTPVQVEGLTGVVAIVAGGGHSLALKNDGTVWAWGENEYGQLGDNTKEDKITPVQVVGL